MKLHIKILVLLCGLVLSGNTWATVNYTPLDSGNIYYLKGNYDKAITSYNKFLDEGNESAQAYYNLGNCYYRKNDIARAILNYEKAKKLDPTDADIQFNLQIANLKTTDKITPDASLSITNWWRGLIDAFSEKGWGIISIVLFVLSLVLFGAYFTSRSLMFRQLGFWGGIVVLAFSLTTFYFAHQQYSILTTHDTGIVVASSVTVTGAPTDNATKLFVVHEGAKVWILKSLGDWTEIRLANGNQGWLLTSDLLPI